MVCESTADALVEPDHDSLSTWLLINESLAIDWLSEVDCIDVDSETTESEPEVELLVDNDDKLFEALIDIETDSEVDIELTVDSEVEPTICDSAVPVVCCICVVSACALPCSSVVVPKIVPKAAKPFA